MKRWWLVIVLLLSLGINVGIVAALVGHRWISEPAEKSKEKEPEKAAEERPGPPLTGQEEVPQRIVRLANQLGLEGDPRRKFIALQGSFFADTLRLRTDQAETHRELRRAMGAPVPDQARIDSLLQESGNTYMALEKAMAKNVLESRKLLKPDQERKFLKLLSRLRLGPGAGGGGQGGGQGPPDQQRRPRPQQPPPPPPPRQDGPPPDDEGPPPGLEGQEPPPPRQQQQGQGLRGGADAPPYGQRRPGMGRRGRMLRRLLGGGPGGQGNPGGPGGPRRPLQGQGQGQPPGDAGPPP